MNKEKTFRWLLFLLFLLVAVFLFRFRPRIEGPEKLEHPSVTETGVVLSGKDFRYEERQGGETRYVVTADEVLETSRVEKELLNPVVVIPGKEGSEDRVLGKKGTLSLSRQEVRIYGGARIEIGRSMAISSPAFRLTPQGEVVSEGRAEITRDELKGAADILRYDRERRIAFLEGNVDLSGPDTSFKATRIIIDFNSHSGEIEGPIEAVKEDFRLGSPRGTMSLDRENRLQSVTLSPPTRGETAAASFASRFSDYRFDRNGAVSEIVLRGEASVARKGADPGRVETEILSLARPAGKDWTWSAPGQMNFFRGEEKIVAGSGSGKIRGSTFTGDLGGPVRGWSGTGEFSSDSARISEGSFELVGNARTVKGGDSVVAEKMVVLQSGEKRAEGSVAGKSVSQSGETFNFTSERASMAKSSYPVKLSGNVHIFSPKIDFKGEEATFLSARSVRACRGASVAARGKDDTVFLYAGQLDYDEAEGRLETAGDSSATDGKSRLSASRKMVLLLDRENKAEKLTAEGSAVYESPNYEARGDRIEYFPKEKKGEVSSEAGMAVVREKNPYRLVTGRTIQFGNRQLGIGSEKGGVHRGKIEGEELKRKSDADGHP